jgi:hypothetical protein
VLVLGTLACAAGGPDGDGPPSGVSVADGSDAASAGTGADPQATGWQESDSDTSEGSGSQGNDPSGDTSEGGASSADESSTGADAESTSGGAGDPPADLWTPCQTDTDCLSGACVVVSIAGEIQGGYCSAPDCSNPIVDCSPPPVGNATPVCIGIMDQAMPPNVHSVCALDCTGGAVCPPGLECVPEVGSICINQQG